MSKLQEIARTIVAEKNGGAEGLCETCEHALLCIIEATEYDAVHDCRYYLPRRQNGWWIPQDETYTKFQCSVCKAKNYGGHERFCPNCGARNRTEPGIIVDVGIGEHPGEPGVEGSQDG